MKITDVRIGSLIEYVFVDEQLFIVIDIDKDKGEMILYNISEQCILDFTNIPTAYDYVLVY